MLDNQHDWREALDTVRTVFASAAHDRTVVVLNLTAAGDRTVWSSDVAKTVLALHDLHPELEFRTIANDGDAQTVIWRRGRTARPRFDTENEIGALTAAEMARHRSLSATVPEDKAMAEVQGWLHPRPPRRLARMARRVGGWRRRGPER